MKGLARSSWWKGVELETENEMASSLKKSKGVRCGWVYLRALAPEQHSSEEASQRWRAVADAVSDLTGPGIESKTSHTNSDLFNRCCNKVDKLDYLLSWLHERGGVVWPVGGEGLAPGVSCNSGVKASCFYEPIDNTLMTSGRCHFFCKFILKLDHSRRNRGGPGLSHFFSEGALIYAFVSTILSLHECIWNLIGLPSKLKPRKELKSRDVFFKILFVGRGEQKLEARAVGLKPTSIGHVTCGQNKYGLQAQGRIYV